MQVKLRPYQEKFLMSAARFPCMVAGIGTGKTFMLLLKVWRFCETFPKSRALICRNEFTDLRDSTMKDFQDYFNVTVGVDKEYKFPNGSVVMFRHGSELNTLKNITLDIAAIEQGEEFQDETQFNFIRDRLRGKNGPYHQLCVIANANGHNWVWKKWVNNPADKEYEVVIANSFENECNLPDEFVKDLRRMAIDAPNHYAQMVMNSFEQMEQDDYVFNFQELLEAKSRIFPFVNGYGYKIFGFDIARFGNDKCAAVGIQQVGALRWKVFHVEQWEHKDLNYTTGRILAIAQEHKSDENIIDEDGIGSGPLDFIQTGRKREDFHGFRNKGLNFSRNQFYGNPRTSAAFKAKEYVTKGWLAIPQEDLINEMMTLRYKFQNDGRRILVSKDEMKKLGIQSPNQADAFLMATSLVDDVHRVQDTSIRVTQNYSKEESLFQIAGVR
jgi:hypothetical protein